MGKCLKTGSVFARAQSQELKGSDWKFFSRAGFDALNLPQHTHCGQTQDNALTVQPPHQQFYLDRCLSVQNRSCVTAAEADCSVFDDTDCALEKLDDYKEEFLNGLYDYCDPTGETCSKCCLLYLKSNLKGDACWEGMMREWTQFLITDGWKNRTVQHMLLACERLHNLDVILLDDKKVDKMGMGVLDENENGGSLGSSNSSTLSAHVVMLLATLALSFPRK